MLYSSTALSYKVEGVILPLSKHDLQPYSSFKTESGRSNIATIFRLFPVGTCALIEGTILGKKVVEKNKTLAEALIRSGRH
jgi:hypothetical protein